MHPLTDHINSVTDIEALIDNAVFESRELDYKESLDLESGRGKREFLKDLTSFANTNGGTLIIGVKEKSGKAVGIVGINIDNLDSFKSRVESIIRDGIEPRIPNVLYKLKLLPLINGNYIFSISIARSLIAPHRVVIDKHDKFYARNSNGAYPMDVTELREAFTSTAMLSDKIRKFIEKRVEYIRAGKRIIKFEQGKPILVLHIIPVVSFLSIVQVDITKIIHQTELKQLLSGVGNQANCLRNNLDGFIGFNQFPTFYINTYAQFFKNGIVEFGDNILLAEKKIRIDKLENHVVHSIEKSMQIFKRLNIEPPYYLCLSFLELSSGHNINEFPVENRERLHFTAGDGDLFFPELLLEQEILDIKKIPFEIRPLFDSIWNAFGHSKSKSFVGNEYKPQKSFR